MAAGVAAGAASIAVAAFLLIGSGGENLAANATIVLPAPVTPDAGIVSSMQLSLVGLSAPTGTTDRDQIRSWLGKPDSFQLSFELSDGGRSEQLVRHETWYYFSLRTAFEFADGKLIANVPTDDVAALAILPRQYDPSTFRAAMTLADVSRLVSRPEGLVRIEAPSELGVGLTAYYGEQLMVVFDGSGLTDVATYPLESGSTP